MFIAPNFPRALLRSEERTDLCICVRRSVRSSERSRKWGRLACYKHIAPPGQEVLRIFGALSSRSHKDARGNTPDLFKLICGHLQYHSYVAHVCTCRTGDDRVTESL